MLQGRRFQRRRRALFTSVCTCIPLIVCLSHHVVTNTVETVASILKNPREPTLFSNRALVRLKLESWAGAEHDSRIAVDLYGLKNPAAIKITYYLAQALLGLQKPGEAYDVALPAYRHSLEIRNPNSEVLSRTILRAKQAIWAAKETARLRDLNETLKRVEEMLESELEGELRQLEESYQAGEIGHIGYVEDQKELKRETEKRIQDVRDAFGTASSGDMKERVSCPPLLLLKPLPQSTDNL
jgi:STIP1 family protein 1